MPLAGYIGVITAIFQQFGNAQRMIIQIAFITRQAFAFVGRFAHRPFADQMMIGAGIQHGPGHRTNGRGMVIGQNPPRFYQVIQIGRADFTAKGANIRIAEIIGNDIQNIGFSPSYGCWCRRHSASA